MLTGKTARVAEIKALGGKATYHAADFRNPSEMADMVAAAASDIVVNNAMLRHFGAVEVARTAIVCTAINPRTLLTPAIDQQLRQEMQRNGTTFEETKDAFWALRQPSHMARRWCMDGGALDRPCNVQRRGKSDDQTYNDRRTTP